MEGSEILRVEDLHTSFFLPIGELQAVRGVSFTLKRGQSLGIVGESGSGKTVLARSIMGLTLAKHVEISGKAFFNGRDLLTLSRREMRSLWGTEIAMIFQDPMTSLNPMVKIGRQVIEHLRQHKNVDRREAKQIALDLLNEVRIPEAESRIDRLPHELSGGMRQRVSIASALACEPSLLFADEPTTALDVTVQHQILNLLSREQRQRNMTMVLVTHDLGVIAGRTDETLVMYAGKVVEQAPTAEIFDNTQHPYTEALMRSIPRTSQPSHTPLAAITGRPPVATHLPKGCAFSPRCPYVQPRCHEEDPSLVSIGTSEHKAACWYPVGSDANREAFERNLSDRLPQTLAVAEALDADQGSETSADVPDGELT
ncbi:MAG: ABC transporter ATP-binding protein [Acidimicrobiales bacterium]|jgi:peptide/nickel transport system ATP-binding protein|nr:ABC transporter ATP-binding protein [Acidimicrobiales bacterium]